MSLDICIHLRNPHCKQDNKSILHLQKISSLLAFLVCKWLEHALCLLSKFLNAQHSIVNCRRYVVQHIFRSYSSCINVTLYPLNSSSFLPLPHLLRIVKYSQCIIIQFLPISLYSLLMCLYWLIIFQYTGLHSFHPILQVHFCIRIFMLAVPSALRALLLTFHISHISHFSSQLKYHLLKNA